MTFLSRRPRSPPRSSGRSGETKPSYGSAISAGESQQFARAMKIASNIENAEARAQAYLLVAESQSHQNQDEQATQTYSEVVSSVARVQQNGLRGVLTGYLVDSLISTGRFEDARGPPWCSTRPRASGSWPWRRSPSLKAGAAPRPRPASGSREARPEYRSALYRRVNSGVLASIETERSSLYLGKDAQQAPSPPSR